MIPEHKAFRLHIDASEMDDPCEAIPLLLEALASVIRFQGFTGAWENLTPTTQYTLKRSYALEEGRIDQPTLPHRHEHKKEETMSEVYERERERHQLAAVYGGYSLCIDNGDGVCDVCHISMDECPACHGIAYHRFGCAEGGS